MTYAWRRVLSALFLSLIMLALVFAEPYHVGTEIARTAGVILTLVLLGLITIIG